jgi:hypothetical protein
MASTSQLAVKTVEMILAGPVAPISGIGIIATGMSQPAISR